MATESSLNGAAAVVRALRDNGVGMVFGIPGTHNLELYRHLAASGIRHVAPRHEQGGGYAADAYARVSGRPGVCITTSGPGLTNIATAAATAYADSIPLLVISPAAPLGQERADVGWLHEVKDQRAAMDSLYDRSIRASSAEQAVAVVHETFARWQVERPRPVHLELPLDVLEAAWSGRAPGPLTPATLWPAPAVLAAAADALRRATAPLIVLGGGARDASSAAVRLAELLGAPVATSVSGKGVVPESHPLSLGARVSLAPVQSAIESADVLLVVGSELASSDLWDVRLRPRGTVIRVDVDLRQLHKNIPADIPLHGDAHTILTTLTTTLTDAAWADTGAAGPDTARAEAGDARGDGRGLGSDGRRLGSDDLGLRSDGLGLDPDGRGLGPDGQGVGPDGLGPEPDGRGLGVVGGRGVAGASEPSSAERAARVHAAAERAAHVRAGVERAAAAHDQAAEERAAPVRATAGVRAAAETVAHGRAAVERAARGRVAVERAAGIRGAAEAAAVEVGGGWRAVQDVLRECLPEDTIVAGDSAQVSYFGTIPFWPMDAPRRFVYPTGYATLGYAIPAAIGAKLAAPDQAVIALAGDGGTLFSVQELAVAAELGLSLPVVVMNNHGYAEIREEMQARHIPTTAVDIRGIDFPALGRAFGGQGERLDGLDDLPAAIARALKAKGPTVIEIICLPQTYS